jgi:hypothetical protein
VPLPLPVRPSKSGSQSHTLRSRFKQRMQVLRIAIGMISVINGLEQGETLNQRTHSQPRFALDEKVRQAQILAISDIMSEATKHARASRDHLSGAHNAAANLVRNVDSEHYHLRMKRSPPQVSLIADRIAEPSDTSFIDMLSALPHEESE